jgi:predicted NAD/FAD-binding protein
VRIAVVGSGISGLVSAWLLSREHSVVIFEAQDHFGGHTHTHEIEVAGRRLAVDSGFIVYNERHYPLLSRLFSELGIESQPTTMSFSVRNDATGLQYNASSLNGLFCQRRNLLSPRFLRMWADLLRFYREAPAALSRLDSNLTLEQYLAQGGYGIAFTRDHLIPMTSALWSCPGRQALSFPARHLLQFMSNHQMLQVSGRVPWRVVRGGSASYVRALRRGWHVEERRATPVTAVRRSPGAVAVRTEQHWEVFDQVVLACHSDQALRLLQDPSEQEVQILGAIGYQSNDAVLHSDPRVLPSKRSAWAAWNAYIPPDDTRDCTVSYCMNLLQGLDVPVPLIVSLNQTARIEPRTIIRRMRYEHPVFDTAAVAAQARKVEIQGKRRTWYAGAYWGWGFHEDGISSAVAVADGLGVTWPKGRQARVPGRQRWEVAA